MSVVVIILYLPQPLLHWFIHLFLLPELIATVHSSLVFPWSFIFLSSLLIHGYNLRPWAHNYELSDKDDRNFIKRLLYNYIYCKKSCVFYLTEMCQKLGKWTLCYMLLLTVFLICNQNPGCGCVSWEVSIFLSKFNKRNDVWCPPVLKFSCPSLTLRSHLYLFLWIPLLSGLQIN